MPDEDSEPSDDSDVRSSESSSGSRSSGRLSSGFPGDACSVIVGDTASARYTCSLGCLLPFDLFLPPLTFDALLAFGFEFFGAAATAIDADWSSARLSWSPRQRDGCAQATISRPIDGC